MKTFSFTAEQLKILQALVSHAHANQREAEDELDIKLEGIDDLEKLLYEGEQTNLELSI